MFELRGWEYTFLEKTLEFLDLLPCPWKFLRKKTFTPGTSAKLCDTPWKLQVRKPRPMIGNSKGFFLLHHWKLHHFLVEHRNFHMFLIQYPWKFHVIKLSSPFRVYFFPWNSRISSNTSAPPIFNSKFKKSAHSYITRICNLNYKRPMYTLTKSNVNIASLPGNSGLSF